MPEPETDPNIDATTEPGLDPPSGAAPSVDTPPDRRSFLRQLSTDAVWTAGKLAGASAVLRRSLVAAGESAMGSLEEVTDPGPATPAVAAAPAVGGRAAAQESIDPRPATQAVAPLAVPDPVAALRPEEHAFLRLGIRATLAVNDPAGPPLLSSSVYHWDGSIIRLPARDFTARTTDIHRDPRVGLLIEDPATGAWVAVTGMASLVYGAQVEADLRLILSKDHDDDGVTRRLTELLATGDQMAIRVRPTRFVWRPA